MPNWTSNKLEIITQNKEDMDKIKKSILNDKNEMSFNILIPVDENTIIDDVASPFVCLTDIRTRKWGTKWEPANVEIIENNNENSFIAEFETAWDPPRFWVKELAEKHKGIEINIRSQYEGQNSVYEGGTDDEGTWFEEYIDFTTFRDMYEYLFKVEFYDYQTAKDTIYELYDLPEEIEYKGKKYKLWDILSSKWQNIDLEENVIIDYNGEPLKINRDGTDVEKPLIDLILDMDPFVDVKNPLDINLPGDFDGV